MESVTSLQNPIIKKYQRLNGSRRFRQHTNSLAIEGPNLVRAALKMGILPEVVIIAEEYYYGKNGKWIALIPDSIRIIVIPAILFREITDTETPQAVAAIIPYSFKDSVDIIISSDIDLVLIMDRIQDPGNMGALIRTAAAAGADLLFCTEGCTDPYGPKVLRSTAGSIFRINIREVSDTKQLLAKLKEEGFLIVAAAGGGDHLYWSAVYKKPVALIIGNEAGGVAAELQSIADLVVSIPLQNSIESLNVAVAAGIILFEIRRQRSAGKT